MVSRSSPDASSDPLNRTRKAVLDAAENWIGTPYRHQASRCQIGCDCLGLIVGVWADVYGNAPRVPRNYSADWSTDDKKDRLLVAARQHCREIKKDAFCPGDLILFRWSEFAPARHLAIAAPEDKIIHAYERQAVSRSSLVPAWRRRIAAAFHFPMIGEEH